jgi:hypothetical protein
MVLEEEVGGRTTSYAHSLNEVESSTAQEGAIVKYISKNAQVNPNVRNFLKDWFKGDARLDGLGGWFCSVM